MAFGNPTVGAARLTRSLAEGLAAQHSTLLTLTATPSSSSDLHYSAGLWSSSDTQRDTRIDSVATVEGNVAERCFATEEARAQAGGCVHALRFTHVGLLLLSKDANETLR